LTTENDGLKKAIRTFGEQRPGFKSVATHNFIEKGQSNELDESGKNILSVSKNKSQVLAVLDEAVEKATSPDIKKSLENEIIGFNAGGAPISEPIASYLYKNHGTRLVS
jgi:hypothetical protein